MAEGSKAAMKNWSCPWCFWRGNDSSGLLYHEEKDMFYCVRCNFTGKDEDILESYQDYQKKYKLVDKRLDIL